MSQEDSTIKIYNLSSTALNAYEVSLFQKGLHFSPTVSPNLFNLFKDLNHFIWSLTWNRHHAHKEQAYIGSPHGTSSPISSFNLEEEEAINILQEW